MDKITVLVSWKHFQPDYRPYRMNSVQFEPVDISVAVEVPNDPKYVASLPPEGVGAILTVEGMTLIMDTLEAAIPSPYPVPNDNDWNDKPTKPATAPEKPAADDWGDDDDWGSAKEEPATETEEPFDDDWE